MSTTHDKNAETAVNETAYVSTADKSVQPLQLSSLDSASASTAIARVPASNPARRPLEKMLDVPIPMVFEVGRTDITIKQLMELREGSFVEMRNVAVDLVDVRVNDKVIAHAEAIGLKKRYAIRFGELTSLSKTGDEDNDA